MCNLSQRRSQGTLGSWEPLEPWELELSEPCFWWQTVRSLANLENLQTSWFQDLRLQFNSLQFNMIQCRDFIAWICEESIPFADTGAYFRGAWNETWHFHGSCGCQELNVWTWDHFLVVETWNLSNNFLVTGPGIVIGVPALLHVDRCTEVYYALKLLTFICWEVFEACDGFRHDGLWMWNCSTMAPAKQYWKSSEVID